METCYSDKFLKYVRGLCTGKEDGDFCLMGRCRAGDCLRPHCRQGICVGRRGYVRLFELIQ